MAILVKYFFGPIWLAPAILFAKGLFAYPARIIVFAPLVFMGILYLTSAEVRAGENELKYRRFISWKQVSYEHIVKCENSWVPSLGYLSLDRFVFPWGKLYFVILRPAFTGDPKGLINFINSRRAGIEVRPPEGSLAGEDRGKGAGFFIFFSIIGIVISLMYAYLTPQFEDQSQLTGFSGIANVYLKFLNAAVNWPWAIATVAVMIGAIVRYRSKGSVWVLALAMGTIIGNMLVRAFH